MTWAGLERRAEHWRRRLAPEWTIILRRDEPDPGPDRDDWGACVMPDLDLGELVIYVRPVVLEQRAAEVDRVIVHEILHGLLDRVLDYDEVLEEQIAPATMRVYRTARRHAMEELVDRLARTVARGSGDWRTVTRAP